MNAVPPPVDVEIDIRGQICPSSLLIALRQMNERREGLRQGEVRIVIRTDNRDATSTIPSAAANMGYPVSTYKDGGHYVIIVGDHGQS